MTAGLSELSPVIPPALTLEVGHRPRVGCSFGVAEHHGMQPSAVRAEHQRIGAERDFLSVHVPLCHVTLTA
jgi:hypothetical protein